MSNNTSQIRSFLFFRFIAILNRNELEDDTLEMEAAFQVAPEWQRPVIAFLTEVSEWTRNASQKGKELIQNDRPISLNEVSLY